MLALVFSIGACSNNDSSPNRLNTNLNDPQIKTVEKYENNIDLMKNAAQQGDVVAMSLLGDKYLKGDGVEKDIKKGIAWLTNAADKGNSLAQQSLGYTYLFESTIQNDSKAFFWFKKSAEQGDGISQLELANMYANGSGVVKDLKLASQWLKKANDNGLDTSSALKYLQK